MGLKRKEKVDRSKEKLGEGGGGGGGHMKDREAEVVNG